MYVTLKSSSAIRLMNYFKFYEGRVSSQLYEGCDSTDFRSLHLQKLPAHFQVDNYYHDPRSKYIAISNQ